MSPAGPRVASVMGVARALMETIDADDAVAVLVAEFGWDVTFQVCSRLTGPRGREAFAHAWQLLGERPAA